MLSYRRSIRASVLCATLTLAAGASAQIAITAAPHSGAVTSQVLELKSGDGTLLKASYFAALRSGPAVLLLHQSNRDRKSWEGEAARLAAAGLNTLTLDLRGYGESAGKRSDFKSMPEDVDAALGFL